jgi:TolC family type I secretion outer membrane protein
MTRLAVVLTLALFACAQVLPESRISSDVSRAPSQEWKGPLPAAPPPAPADPALLSQLPKPGTPITLRQLVSFALQNSPQTRSTWLSARAAAAGVVSRRSAYYPQIDAQAQLGYSHTTLGKGAFTFDQFTFTPGATLNYLLFDLGGRSADVGEAEALLEAANLTHNVAIQDLVLRVEQAYYQYLSAKALVAADRETVRNAETAYQAAEERRNAGVATVADVLQAKTQLSQARLVLQQSEGQVATVRGALATSLGVPANLPVDVGELPEDLALRPIGEAVEKLIEQAQAQRPDLARARAQALAAASRQSSIRSRGLPSLVLGAGASRNYFLDSCCVHGDTYSAAVTLRIPVFNGFRDSADLLQAREQARAAEADAQSVEQQIILQVWSSYQAVKTAELRIGTSRDLLASAQASAEVAQGRYKAGVGSILDLLTAQAALANARAQEVQARADWLVSVATLSHDTGALALPPEGTQ